MMNRMFCAVLCVLWLAPVARAWSAKEHILFTRLAAQRLIDDPGTPDAMKAFLRQAMPNTFTPEQEQAFYMTARVGASKGDAQEKIEYWSIAPDVFAASNKRDSVVEPFGVHERQMHFVDAEYFQADRKLGYKDDLSGKPGVKDIPRNMTDARWPRAGMLPFAVEHSYRKLVESIRDNRLTTTGSKDVSTDDAVRWAGYLAHYVQDNTQPHHATIDYKSQSYFGDMRDPPNVHAEMEYRMVDDDSGDFVELRTKYWPMFQEQLAVKDPEVSDDPWLATVEVALYSYDALPLIGRAAAASKTKADPSTKKRAGVNTDAFFRFEGNFQGQKMTVLDMKAIQTARAVKRTQLMWLKAWKEATGPKE